MMYASVLAVTSTGLNLSQLETQLQMLGCMEINSSTSTPCTIQFSDIHRHFKGLSSSKSMLVLEVVQILKFAIFIRSRNHGKVHLMNN